MPPPMPILYSQTSEEATLPLLFGRGSYVGEQKSDFGLQGGGNTVHKRILEFVLYYIRFDLQGEFPPPPVPPYAHVWRGFIGGFSFPPLFATRYERWLYMTPQRETRTTGLESFPSLCTRYMGRIFLPWFSFLRTRRAGS